MQAKPAAVSAALLSLEQVMPLAQSLALREAHRPDDADDLMQVGLFAYFKAMHQNSPVEKPRAFAATVLQRAMRGYYYQQREWQQRGEPNKAVGFDQVGMRDRGGERLPPMLVVGLDGRADADEQMELFEFNDYFMALEQACGATARRMVENLVLPSGTCAANILAEARGKAEAQKQYANASRAERRAQPRGVKKGIRISHRLIRDAMGLSAAEWTMNMDRVREFTLEWCGR